MRFNKSEVTGLAAQPSHKFEKEGVLFIREKQEGFFRKTESKTLPFLWKWLFRHKNFTAAAVFGQIDAGWPQGQKKNFVKLPSDQPKDTERNQKRIFFENI